MRLLLLLLLLPLAAGASPLDEALAIVQAGNPVLIAEHRQLDMLDRQRNWTARVSLGWTKRGTEYGGGAGSNAGVQLSIPLFDRKRDLDRAEALSGLAATRARITAGFLADVKALDKQAVDLVSAGKLRDLARDRLEYRRKQVDEGLQEADRLWSEAEAFQKAEQDVEQARAALEAGLEATAREYGGEEWKQLRALLAAHVKRN